MRASAELIESHDLELDPSSTAVHPCRPPQPTRRAADDAVWLIPIVATLAYAWLLVRDALALS